MRSLNKYRLWKIMAGMAAVLILSSLTVSLNGCASKETKAQYVEASNAQKAAADKAFADKLAADRAAAEAANALKAAATQPDNAEAQAVLQAAIAKQIAATEAMTASTTELTVANGKLAVATDNYNESVKQNTESVRKGITIVGNAASTSVPGYGSIIGIICTGLAGLVGIFATAQIKEKKVTTAENQTAVAEAVAKKKDDVLWQTVDSASILAAHIQTDFATKTPETKVPPSVTNALNFIAHLNTGDAAEASKIANA